jgi:hypothetical protein
MCHILILLTASRYDVHRSPAYRSVERQSVSVPDTLLCWWQIEQILCLSVSNKQPFRLNPSTQLRSHWSVVHLGEYKPERRRLSLRQRRDARSGNHHKLSHSIKRTTRDCITTLNETVRYFVNTTTSFWIFIITLYVFYIHFILYFTLQTHHAVPQVLTCTTTGKGFKWISNLSFYLNRCEIEISIIQLSL